MNQSFDTTAWLLQTMLILIALFAGLPAIRAAIGILLIAMARGLGYEEGRLHRAGVRIMPALVRGFLGVGVSLGALAAPAHAASPPMPPSTIVIDRVVAFADAAAGAETTATVEPEATSQVEASYQVKAGDSLWAIAAERLAQQGLDPSAREIDQEWRRLWHLNRSEIGANPSLIHPGLELRLQGDAGN